MSQLTACLIDVEATRLLSKGLRPNYVHTHLRVIRQVLQTAGKWRVLRPEDVIPLSSVRVDETEPHIPTADERMSAKLEALSQPCGMSADGFVQRLIAQADPPGVSASAQRIVEAG